MLIMAGVLGLMVAGAAASLVPSGTSDEHDDGDQPSEKPVPDQAGQPDFLDDYGNPPDQYDPTTGTGTSDGFETPVRGDAPAPTDGADTLWGDDGDDWIEAGDGNDLVNGYAGNDALFGGAGRDSVAGGAGDDTLYGGDGNDTLVGDHGDDRLYGDAGDDSLYGGMGDDTLSGGPGADSLVGGAGADLLYGGDGDDILDGADGNDTLYGGAGRNMIEGGSGDDLLVGGSGERSFLNGGEGEDTLVGGPLDILSGGEDADTFVIKDMIIPDSPTEITDYDGAQDQVVVLYDDEKDEVPIIGVEPAENPHDAWVLVNGERAILVRGGAMLHPEDVSFMTNRQFVAL